MIKLDPTKMYYLSHPCTSVGMVAENREKEQECVVNILTSQQNGVAYLGQPARNKIKLIRPLTLIPDNMDWSTAMDRCIKLLRICDGIIMCGEWEKSRGCAQEYWKAVDAGIVIFRFEDVVR
ncbi:MAG: DUF4406 domain-containing protein [Eubacterium sp.]